MILFKGPVPFFFKYYSLIPFKTIIAYFNVEGTTPFSAFVNLAGNIIGFIPLGFLVPLIFRKLNTFWKVILIVFSTSFIFELAQLIFKLGIFDVDDLILNTLGGVLGYIMFKLLKHFLKW